MRYIFLSEKFYDDYSNCLEIEHKRFRPYIMLILQIDNLTFALPMRSHIKHKYAYITDAENNCGVDYSKAVIINDEEKYIAKIKPNIRENEYKALFGKEYIITKEFSKYLSNYKKSIIAKADRTKYMYKYSTLKYFHKELNIGN